ncbi:MAG: DUF72 domain-containing protein [Chloroflexaceae bacterium]|nr:DUF72 domain-containing protein [Chloroflexaceae bacterium]
MSIHIGTSGWSYDHWHGVLYPHGSPPAERLHHYIQRYHTVELNSSFYRWPADRIFASWNRRLPTGFQMSVKAPRGLTHGCRLYAPEQWIDRIRRGMHHLGDKRGMLLVQLPPDQPYDYARLAYFLHLLPEWLHVAVELRHASWHQSEIFALLEQTGTAYCVMSGAYLPCVLRATARRVYVRLHGPDHHALYSGAYAEQDLRWWAERIQEWDRMGLAVYAYFNNDGNGYAVYNADTLRSLLGRG